MSSGSVPRVGALIRRNLRELRGQLRYWLGLVLQRLFGRRHTATRLDAREIHSVLIGRINGRLGNTLFLTPMLERVHALLPQASIDLALSYPQAPGLLAGLPGVRRIILFPHKGRGLIAQYWRALRQLRATHYDLAIDPTPFSTSGRLILSLTRARFRLGFSLPSQWAALTHGIPLPSQIMHQGRQPAYLLTTALGATWEPAATRLWLPLRPEEIAAGRAAISAALQALDVAISPGQTLVGYFGHATGLKALAPAWWGRFWQAFRALRPDVTPVEFLPGARTSPTVAGFATLHLPSQRQLTAAISTLQLFIAADSGPMHLASSTDTPTMGLFQVTDSALYGPLKSVDRSIEVAGLTPEEVAAKVSAAWSM
ncbi:MAG TPA: glycosyltransferase family 9 protein [Steroidobacteraceae bacterium]|nr:glycosyltransferase family 9 protein [Steroidobacteraceae bacterium]